MVVKNLKIRLRVNWHNKGEGALEDFLSAIRRPGVSEAVWGEFHILATPVLGRTYYQMWIGDGPIYDEEDLNKLVPIIRENL